MANVFNMLRSNDLIWPYVINNYLRGKKPLPFDLLYWNSDATRMPAANHSFYLRNCYLENKLANGEMVLGGETIDLKAIKIPIYNLATREDHIAPAKSVLLGCNSSAARSSSCCPAPATSPASSTRRTRRSTSIGPARGRQRRPRWLAGQGRGASGLVVAGLVCLAHDARRDRVPARAPGGGARADRGRAGQLCEGAGLSTAT